MRNILVIDSWSGLGGGQRVAFDLASGLRSKQTFVYMAPIGPYFEFYQKEGIMTREIRAKSLFCTILEIRCALKQISPEIVHVHGTRAAIWTRLAFITLRRKPKFVYTVHGFHLVHKKGVLRFLLLTLERFLNRYTDAMVCVCKHDYDTIVALKCMDSKKISVILNGINIDYWKIEIPLPISLPFVSQGVNVIGVINRLHAPKDVATILRAFANLKSDFQKSIVLMIVGDGPLRSEMETYAKKLCIDQNVFFVGDQNDVRPFLHLCDIVVVSSLWEGLCLGVLEAGACKKPVVVSNFIGVEEVVVSEKTGLTFPIGSSELLKKQLRCLLDSPELRKKVGNTAYDFVQERFFLARMLVAYEEIYERFF